MRHIPVLLTETLAGLNLKAGDNAADCTLGDGGHSEAILQATSPTGRLLGIDADAESVLRAKRFLYRFENRAEFARANFVELEAIVKQTGFGPIKGILFDLGWSTPQFKERGRGFSFEQDEPLDMRFSGKEQNVETATAGEIVNYYPVSELAKIFKNFGEEKLSQEIAQAIGEARKIAPLTTTKQLVEIILEVYRRKLHSDKEIPWVGGTHPATKVFQALRIAVNGELEKLKQVLPMAVSLLAPGGRLAVITFHSLEDRIAKQYFKSQENKILKLINKKPIVASKEEVKNNPSARSAKLRIIEKI